MHLHKWEGFFFFIWHSSASCSLNHVSGNSVKKKKTWLAHFSAGPLQLCVLSLLWLVHLCACVYERVCVWSWQQRDLTAWEWPYKEGELWTKCTWTHTLEKRELERERERKSWKSNNLCVFLCLVSFILHRFFGRRTDYNYFAHTTCACKGMRVCAFLK